MSTPEQLGGGDDHHLDRAGVVDEPQALDHDP